MKTSTGDVDVISGAVGVSVASILDGRFGGQGEGVDDVGAELVLDAAVALLPSDASCDTEKVF